MNEQTKAANVVLDIAEIQKKLLVERRTRITVMSFLLSALIFTIIYGTLENPFQYTFSKIGNRFDPALRVVFIVWASYTGFAIQTSIIALFRLERYTNKLHYIYILIGVVFLVFTALAPSLDHLPFWIWVHIVTGLLFAVFLTMGFLPFMRWVARENPRLRKTVYIWFAISWGGSLSFAFILGNTGAFELFFFCTFIVFLLYLSLTLFEEQIIKRSVNLLSGVEDLNRGIEDIFFPEFMRMKQKSKIKRLRKIIRKKKAKSK